MGQLARCLGRDAALQQVGLRAPVLEADACTPSGAGRANTKPETRVFCFC